MIEITEQSIQAALLLRFIASHKAQSVNMKLCRWESDYIALSRSGYLVEMEIKISKSDFKADFKKTVGQTLKHDVLQSGVCTTTMGRPKSVLCPNRFSYVVPCGLLDLSDVPEWAGLWEFDSELDTWRHGDRLRKVREPSLLHASKPDANKIEGQIHRSAYYRFIRHKIESGVSK